MMDFGQSANRGEVFGSELQNIFELFPRVRKAADFNQRPAERDMSGEIGWMPDEAGRAGLDRFFKPSGATVFLRQRREGDRRRVRMDPALQLFYARTVRHG